MGASAITLIVCRCIPRVRTSTKRRASQLKAGATFEKGVQKVSILFPARGKAISDNQ